MASPAAYHFQPLAEKSIRLMKIHPGLRNGLVACTLTQYDEHFPPYDALSYYWGDPKPTRQIYVNDSVVDIHEALWEFLDQMQRSHQTESWIWTDFLCLNQSNHEEMGHQIPRMGHIYSEAKMTISWLG
ncbi:heterokaryon incompatibility protein-domain-containing protein, partial [Diaporthe sp. PMI_573]